MAKAGFFTHVLAVAACLGVLAVLEMLFVGQLPLLGGLLLLALVGCAAGALLGRCTRTTRKPRAKRAPRRRASVRVMPAMARNIPPAA